VALVHPDRALLQVAGYGTAPFQRLRQPGEQLLHGPLAAGEEAVRVAGLLDALPVFAEGSEAVPVEHHHLPVVVGQHARCQQPPDARSDDDGPVPLRLPLM
jgi:hypothetical protein